MGRTGIPFDRERLLLWIVGGMFIACIGRPWRTLPRMLLDWSIFIIGVTLYDFARGAARFVDAPVQVTPQADIDRIIGLGHVPTVWLQQHFLETQPRWWDAAASIIYASHFILPFVVAGILYATNRKEWGWFASRFLVLCFLGCVTYALIPTAPPWYASQIGEIGHVVRSTGRGWQDRPRARRGDVDPQGPARRQRVRGDPLAARRVGGALRDRGVAARQEPRSLARVRVPRGDGAHARVHRRALLHRCDRRMDLPRARSAWGCRSSNERGVAGAIPRRGPDDSGLPSSDDAVMASSVRDLPASDASGRHEPDPQPAT